MANCYACKAEIVFDNEHVGRNGKKIPLDPSTHQPHDCPMREKRTATLGESNQSERVDIEAKEDHGNEQTWPNGTLKIRNPDNIGTDDLIPKFVDHTLKGQSKVKIFYGSPNETEDDYNKFLADHNGKIKTQGAQFQMNTSDALFAIALYYEEVK